MTGEDFKNRFKELTGNEPLSWQTRLYDSFFAKGVLPSVIDLSTGLGKTMVMAIWLIAKAHQEKLKITIPTRLIYVVDRRTVVDQATDVAMKLVTNWIEKKVFPTEPPAISTLRGQLADNREWSRDPSRPAIIIGTVDLIGSALLFSGYRSGFKTRPLHTGLLGQDSLLVLDEAHLSRPFEKLICAINADGPFQKDRENNAHGKPMQVIRMSATSDNATSKDVFRLDTDPNSKTFDLWSKLDENRKEENPIKSRFEAKKHLTIKPEVDPKKLNDVMADDAIALAKDSSLRGKRIVVFVRRPDDARTIAKIIREYAIESIDKSVSKPKKIKHTPYAASVEILTGTMRGMERDELVGKPVLKRFLDGDEVPGANDDPVFLISTSAGEVGMDLNADHTVCDATTIDSLIQRLGRVNRRGLGEAQIHLFVEPPKTEKDGKLKKLEGIDLAIANTRKLLHGVTDVSPKNIAALKSGQWRDTYTDACSPNVPTVELTDILLDAWSMTSITERMPGRPEVAPWLRGIADDLPQTTIAWRAELELFQNVAKPEKALQVIFAKHRIRPHEALTVNTRYLVEVLKQVSRLKDRASDLMSSQVAVRLPRGQIVRRTLQQLIDEPGVLYADSTLIFSARFGGLDKSGMLDTDSIPKTRKDDDQELSSLDVADRDRYKSTNEARARFRLLIQRTDAGWKASPLPGGEPIPDDLELDRDYEKSKDLFNDLRKGDFRIRLVQPIEFDEEGDAIKSLVLLAPIVKGKKPDNQSLSDHVGAVETEAKRIADALTLAEDDPVRIALLFAAKWHDEGKKADIWQRFIGYETGEPLGKGKSPRDPKSLRGYRHEFGSLLRIHHPDHCETTGCVLPANPDARELALHLIATHHGMGRPHFDEAIYADFSDDERDAIHTESIRRFARLQKKYGWWHLAWLENLLRCADQLASAQAGSTGEEDETEDAE